MARMTLQADATELMSAILEMRALYGDGAGVPNRVVERCKGLLSAEGKKNNRFVQALPPKNGIIEMVPGHELNAVLVDLRVVRNAARHP